MSKVTVSIIIPIYNGSRHLGVFWESLKKQLSPSYEVIAIDDGSCENVFDSMPDFLEHPCVTNIRNKQSEGFSKVVNKGISESIGEFIIIMNSDLILIEGALDSLIKCSVTNEKIGLVGATLFFPQTCGVQHMGTAFAETNECHFFFHMPYDHELVSREREVQGISFGLCCLPRKVYDQVGPLDEGYFNSYEDVDYCFRVMSSGYKIINTPNAKGYHWERQSGFQRNVRRKDNIARLWRDWGTQMVPDLDIYIKECWESIVKKHSNICQKDYTAIYLGKETRAEYTLNTVTSKTIPISISDIWNYSQTSNSNAKIWMPMILPYSAAYHPTPFVYIVDQFPDLNENRYWFAARRQSVENELVFDSHANVLLTDDIDVINI